jgi:hypothetical protein
VEGHSLSIDESTMTGESHPVSFNIDKHLSDMFFACREDAIPIFLGADEVVWFL